ncbi:hypothetical protein BDM02DRAFT_3186288 [Thelephora ganbajun]|uniref:Uncharacterized protein n=1 Tax=Thelephora ganbajun TaxID=370292 RepID=A0ACB6ZJ82_THEGA|nr:hypothetical protein BDM02DRAFT_3186288 [Thelephora ganbajun]
MAEANPMSAVISEGSSVYGSTPNPLRDVVDAFMREINGLKTKIASLEAKIDGLKKVKVEAAASGDPPVKSEVKSEPLEDALVIDSEGTPAPAQWEDALDNEQMYLTREEQEHMEVDDGPGDVPQDTGDVGRQVIASVPSRRQSTEEPAWTTPPRGEVLFKVNPEHTWRIAVTNGIVPPPAQVLTLPSQPRDETPPLPPRSPSPPPFVPLTRAFGIIPASQAKRKRDFELIIEIPAKRFKASQYPTPSSSSNGFVASSSSTTLDSPAVTIVRAPAQKVCTGSCRKVIIREIGGTRFKVDLNPEIRSVTVTRHFMWSHFGTHQVHPFSEPPKDQVDRHGYDHFVFIHEDNGPQVPFVPGEPGLVTHFEDRSWPALDRYRVFGRVNAFPARWKYMGLYKATKLPAWTPEEIKGLGLTIKSRWATTVRESKWAHPILARIMLRKKLGRKPTNDEVDDQIQKLKRVSTPLPPLHIIAAALENGEEKLYPWKLECEGYEENLQWEISITFPRYEKEAKSRRPNASGKT